MQGLTSILFSIIVLIMSVVIHEVAHGAMANSLGDPTAKLQGRLNLNPLLHLDPIGSFIVPLILYFASSGTFMFGWAKPVPYNPYNLRNQRTGPALVAAAGPLTNLAVAIIFSLFFQVLPQSALSVQLFATVIVINVALAVFNLFPIPPLDGSKILFGLLPARWEWIQHTMEQYGLIILILFLFFGGSIIGSAVNAVLGLLIH